MEPQQLRSTFSRYNKKIRKLEEISAIIIRTKLRSYALIIDLMRKLDVLGNGWIYFGYLNVLGNF